ncbi:MAG: WD40 repeat domain-containing protein [Saprospiraceae bacterium]|nr:WD40 repeat domain-containing protein [Saprospiraceae bacterium]
MIRQSLILSAAVLILQTARADFNPKPVVEFKANAALITLDYSPDGKKIVVGGQTNEVSIYDIAENKTVLTLKGHTDNVVAVKYSPNGRYIASGGVDNKLILWDAITGDIIYKHAAHRDYVRDVAFSPDSKLLASASWDGTANVWNTLTGEVLTTITAHLDNVTTVAFSPDGSELLTGSGDKTIRAWDTKTWQQKFILNGHTDEVWDARYAPNGKFVAGGAWDNKARVWDLKDRREIFTFPAHTSDVWSVAFSPSNQLLATGGGDRKVKIWDLAMGDMVADLSGDIFTAEVESVSFSPDGKHVAAVSRDGFLRIFETPSVQDRKSAFMTKRMTEWNVKGNYEKSEDYQQRLEKKTRQESIFAEEFDKKATDFFNQTSDWQKLQLKEYDADKEIYKVYSPVLGLLGVRVSPKEAEIFKENFSQIQFKSSRFIIGTKAIELEKVEINLPSGNDTKAFLMTSIK